MILRILRSSFTGLWLLAVNQSGFAEYQSAAHLGFGLQRSSTIGFKDVAGSLVFLDACKVFSSTKIGLRTLGQGGHKFGASYYRMATGIVGGYFIFDGKTGYEFQVAMMGFKESGLDERNDPLYGSSGNLLMIGWQRQKELIRGVHFGLGAFITHHQGSMNGIKASTPMPKAVSRNRGTTQGLDMSLKVVL
jgi:hypothetical protein